jgi:hypothetical protein
MSTAPTAASETRSLPSAARGVGEAVQEVPVDVVGLSSLGGNGARSVPNPGVTAAEMGAASFPASDPPATWTWDVPQSTPRS